MRLAEIQDGIVINELNGIVARKEALEWGVFRGEGQEKNYTPDVGLGERGRYTPLPTLPGAVPVVTIGFICPMTMRMAYSRINSTYIAGIRDLYLR